MDPSTVSHGSQPASGPIRRRRDDLRHGLAEPGNQDWIARLPDPGEHRKTSGLELGNLHLFHAKNVPWSEIMVHYTGTQAWRQAYAGSPAAASSTAATMGA